MADTSGLDPSRKEDAKTPLSCYQCRVRKLKCDRQFPACSRCVKIGEDCQYPASRQRPTYVTKRRNVKDLEARLKDLEDRFKNETVQASESPQPPQIPPETQLLGTGRFEQLPPQELIDELTCLYFERLHPEAPMLHPARYIASLYLPPHMRPPMCLQYAVMALAATVSPERSSLALPLYQRARDYIQADEMKGNGHGFVTLAHAQSWVILAILEARNLWFSRASMSVSRSVRLSQILGLHNIDHPGNLAPTLPPPRDWCEKEERRRTLWAIFSTDQICSSTTGWPVLMDSRHIKTLLPVSEEAFQLGIEEPAITLHEALRPDSAISSGLAYRVLAGHLFHECLDHTSSDNLDDNPGDIEHSTFWKRHRNLDDRLAIMFMVLPDSLQCPSNIHDLTAVFINLVLHTATICLHRAGVARSKQYNIDISVLSRTQARLLIAAQGIVAILTALSDRESLFRQQFAGFSAFMGASVFLEDYARSQNRLSEEGLDILMNLTVKIGSQNPMNASLAVQMAHEIKKSGVDPSALHKVHGLMSRLDSSLPLMGKHDDVTGSALFCPFELVSGIETPISPITSLHQATNLPLSSQPLFDGFYRYM